MGFETRRETLFCDGLSVPSIADLAAATPFYLYSKDQIRKNYRAYARALASIPHRIHYAVKANGNLSILRLLRELGAQVTLVSGNELILAQRAGYASDQMLLNGNGKTRNELVLAIQQRVMLNIDSKFDAERIVSLTADTKTKANVMLRLSPDVDPHVHPYISTGLQTSKFGVQLDAVPDLLTLLRSCPWVDVIGLHFHLGSTVRGVMVYRDAIARVKDAWIQVKQAGYRPTYLNIGGGLGIDYSHEEINFPGPADIVSAVRDVLPPDAVLIVEPGRSLVGNAGMLVARVIGVKQGGTASFVVVDASMAELLRPSLYQAYHHIGFAHPVEGIKRPYDIVGPVCESADFLGKARQLPTPSEGDLLVVHDTGAYGYAMSSNYNARLRPAEYWVEDGKLETIRKAETIDDLSRLFSG